MTKKIKKSLFLSMSSFMFISNCYAQAITTPSSRQLENPLGRIIGMMITKQPSQKLCGPAENSTWTLHVANGNVVHTMPYGKFISALGEIVCGPLNVDGYGTSSFHEKAVHVLQSEDSKTVLLTEFDKLPEGVKTIFCKNARIFNVDLWNVLGKTCS